MCFQILNQFHQFTIIMSADQNFDDICLKFFDSTADYFYRKKNKKYWKYQYFNTFLK